MKECSYILDLSEVRGALERKDISESVGVGHILRRTKLALKKINKKHKKVIEFLNDFYNAVSGYIEYPEFDSLISLVLVKLTYLPIACNQKSEMLDVVF